MNGTLDTVGIGQVVDLAAEIAQPEAVPLPHAVEFRNVTKTYNIGRSNENKIGKI